MQGVSAFNFRCFQQPIGSCDIVLTAYQRCSQNLAAASTSVKDFVSMLVRPHKRECMRTAKIGPYLRLWNKPCFSPNVHIQIEVQQMQTAELWTGR